MNGLDLFSGIGGISLALEPWVRPVAYCENERYAQAVLLSRMRDGGLPVAPIWDDVLTLNGSDLPPIDIIYGGFPCQDISSAGRGAGMEQGSRSGLFFEIMRLTQEIRPTFVFLENVPAIRTRGLSRVLSEFTALGYDCRWTVVSAAEVGAPHLRKRWFLLAADTDCSDLWIQQRGSSWTHREDSLLPRTALEVGENSNANGFAKSMGHSTKRIENFVMLWTLEGDSWNDHARELLRMDDGIPFRLDRLRGLGNAVVPLQARVAFQRLMGVMTPKPLQSELSGAAG